MPAEAGVHDLTAVSLFSGVGGLDLGVERAGFRVLVQAESDSYRRDVLRARFPGAELHEDVREVATGGSERPLTGELGGGDGCSDGRRGGARSEDGDAGVDLVFGGFPCQDLSVAGQRRGLEGERSGLFYEYARVVAAVRPRWLLVENVPGLLSSQGGRDFGAVLGTLADLGYGLGWRILDSRFFGVPQRRRRVFIVGTRADGDPRAAAERASQVLAVGTRCPRHSATRGETWEDVAVESLSGLGSGGPDDNDGQGGRLIANGLVKRYGKGTDSDATDTLIAAPLSHGSNPNSNAAGRRREDDENLVIAGPLGGGNDGIGRRSEDDPNLVTAFAWQQGDDSKHGKDGRGRSWITRAGDYTGALSRTRHDAVAGAEVGVRRLTPTECERLQAFPDGWTDLGGTADSKRYAALGDAVTVTVAHWIATRIAQELRP